MPVMDRLCALVFPLLALSLLVGCVSSAPYVWVDEYAHEQEQPAEDGQYAIRSGDTLQISVWRQPEMATEAWVRPDGMISVPLAGDVRVVGLSPASAAQQIERALKGKVTAPVSVVVSESAPQTIAVLGEVETPGRFPLRSGDTVLDALARAGGLSEYARKEHIYLLREGEPKRIRFSFYKLSGAVGRGILFKLKDGDIIVVE